MIARVHFIGTITHNKKKFGLKDYVDIHVAALADAEEIFRFWLSKDYSIKGHNGVWHLQGAHGKVEFVKAEERPKE
jgi:hypothetical protein